MATVDMFQSAKAPNDEDLTTRLLIQLQLEDVEGLMSSAKGKGREGQLSDAELALRSYKKELESRASFLTDQRMARSIAMAVVSDGNAIAASESLEESAAQDRDFALQLSGRRPSSGVKPWAKTARQLDDKLLQKFAGLWVPQMKEHMDGDDEIHGSESSDVIRGFGESSTWASTRSQSGIVEKHHCIACREDKKFWEVICTPCKHEYCSECLQDLFTSAMSDESLFPPRCCRQPIAVNSVQTFLSSEIVREFEQKRIEFNTPDKTYCCSSSCSAFIHPDNIQEDCATCTDCGTLTCKLCKFVAHGGDCPADKGLQQLLDMATENGWQRCHNCRRLVELDTGCNHITCKCGAQFCYVCGKRWKTCACIQWDEHRLLARATQVVAREPRRAGQAHEIAAAIQHLRTRHQCNHDSWRYVRGPHQCEECYHTLPSYIFECRQCRIQACNRCKNNRL